MRDFILMTVNDKNLRRMWLLYLASLGAMVVCLITGSTAALFVQIAFLVPSLFYGFRAIRATGTSSS